MMTYDDLNEIFYRYGWSGRLEYGEYIPSRHLYGLIIDHDPDEIDPHCKRSGYSVPCFNEITSEIEYLTMLDYIQFDDEIIRIVPSDFNITLDDAIKSVMRENPDGIIESISETDDYFIIELNIDTDGYEVVKKKTGECRYMKTADCRKLFGDNKERRLCVPVRDD